MGPPERAEPPTFRTSVARAIPTFPRPGRRCSAARGIAAGRRAAQVLAHLRREQAGGRRRAALLTGSLEPLVGDLAARLGCGLVATVPALAPPAPAPAGPDGGGGGGGGGGVYTGRVAGGVCVHDEKRRRMLLAAAPRAGGGAGAVGGPGLAGVGNSMYDAPFLAAVDRAAVVRPGRRLRRLAAQRGWDLSLAAVRAGGAGGGAEPGPGPGPAARAVQSLELCVGGAWALLAAAAACVVGARGRLRLARV